MLHITTVVVDVEVTLIPSDKTTQPSQELGPGSILVHTDFTRDAFSINTNDTMKYKRLYL